MRTILNLLNALFTCSHEKITWPQTVKRDRKWPPLEPRTYVVCLNCGKEFPYSWAEMRIVGEAKKALTVRQRPRVNVVEIDKVRRIKA